MKTVYRLGSLIVAAAVILGASRLWAENKDKKPAAPRTRIGLLNLTYVVKNYDKFKQFQKEIKEIVGPFQKREAELRAELKKLQSQAKNSSILPAKGEESDEKSRKKELEEKSKKIQQEIEDNKQKAKKKVGKRSDDEMKLYFKEVEEAVERYATAHNLDLVMHFNDALTKEDYYSAKNIARKLNTGALMPIYMVRGIDISNDILYDLNQRSSGGN